MTDSRTPKDETEPVDTDAWRAAAARQASTTGAVSYSPAPDPRASWPATQWAGSVMFDSASWTGSGHNNLTCDSRLCLPITALFPGIQIPG